MIRINETINLCNPIYCYNVIDDKKSSLRQSDFITFRFYSIYRKNNCSFSFFFFHDDVLNHNTITLYLE